MLKTALANPDDEQGKGRTFRAISAHEHFEAQRSSTKDLPHPELFLKNFTLRAVEILAGHRDLHQIARWTTDEVFASMQKQVNARVRKMSLMPPDARRKLTLHFEVTSVRWCEPRDGIIEGCVMVRTNKQNRVAALRIEGLDRRWRTSSFTLL